MVLYLLRAYFAKKLYKGSILRNHLKRNVAHAIRMVCHVLLLLPIAIRLGFFFSFFEMVCLAGKLATQRNAVQVNPPKSVRFTFSRGTRMHVAPRTKEHEIALYTRSAMAAP
jgi:hypothetical protein